VLSRFTAPRGTLPVREIVLFESRLLPRGARYVAIARGRLGG